MEQSATRGEEPVGGDEGFLGAVDKYAAGENNSTDNDKESDEKSEKTEKDKEDNNNINGYPVWYIGILIFVHSMTFAALIINMKHLMTAQGFQHPLVISAFNSLGPLLMAVWMLEMQRRSSTINKDTTVDGGSVEDSSVEEDKEESVSRQLQRAFKEKWMWIGAVSADAGLVLVGRSLFCAVLVGWKFF